MVALESAEFEPVRILEVEIGEPLPDVPVKDGQTAQVYSRALILVRLHSQTMGVGGGRIRIRGLADWSRIATGFMEGTRPGCR